MKYILSNFSIVLFFVLFSCAPQLNTTIGKKLVIKDQVAKAAPVPIKHKPSFKDQLSAFYEKPQVFLINTQQDTIIRGLQGTRIELHAFCLVDENANVVDGLVRIELKELYTKTDMILSNKATMSNGKLLESNGEIYLNATLNGKQLRIGCTEGLQVALATQPLDKMVMWAGTINSNGNINWEKDSTMRVLNENGSSTEYLDAEENGMADIWFNYENNFLFTTQKFGWINCDRFYEDDRPKVDMYVSIKNPFPKGYPVYVYALFTGINSVMQLYSGDGGNFILSNVPEGEIITVVCMSETEKKTFFSMKETIIVKNQKESVELQPLAKEEIKKVLSSL